MQAVKIIYDSSFRWRTDSGVVEAGGHEHGGVVLGLHIVVGRVALDVREVLLFVGVAPLTADTHTCTMKRM